MLSPSWNWLRKKQGISPIVRRPQALRIEELEARLLLDATPPGYTPTQIRHAYSLDQVGFLTTNGAPDAAKYNATAGLGQTIAIVDAYDDTSIASDLHQFDVAFGLPDPPSFTQLNQSGGTGQPASAENTGWGLEISLDVEWAHTMAPAANIVLVQGGSDLFAAVQTAASLPGVSVVTMSFGLPDVPSDLFTDRIFTTPAGHQGVVFFASSGDSGAPTIFPSDSPNVIAVGGTTLMLDAAGNITSETAWSGSGGGNSSVESGASFQSGATGQGTAGRSTPDIGFDADPNTGVPVYDSLDFPSDSPWVQVGGTSFSSPAWAGMTSLADQARFAAGKPSLGGATQLLPLLYQLPAADFNDVTGGLSFGFPDLSATTGYDQTTGIGTPIASKLIPDLVAYTPPSSHTTVYWTGVTGDDNWNNPANWSFTDPLGGAAPSADIVPGPTNDVVIDLPHIVINHTAGSYETLHSLTISAKSVTLNVAAGSIDLSSGNGAIGALNASQAGTVINLTGGVVKNANLQTGTALVVPTGSTAVLDGGVFGGTIQVKQGGTLALQGAWTNNGSITVSPGATVYIGDAPDFNDAWSSSPTDPGAAQHTWVNNGTLTFSSDVVYLGGLLTYASTNFGGLIFKLTDTIHLAGTLVNTGHTLTMTSNWSFDGGRITGGTLVIPAGSGVVVDANGGYLQNLTAFTLNGTLDLEGSPLEAFLEDDFSTIGGDAVLTIDNSNAPLGILGSGTILFGETDSSVGSSDPRTGLADQIFVLGNALTLPSSMNVVAGGADADGNPEYGILNGNIINQGTINCTGPGELDLDGSVVNQGTIKITAGGGLFMNGSVTNTGSIQEISGGFLEIIGTVDNQGAIRETGGGDLLINPDQFDPTNPDSSVVTWTNEKTITVTSGFLFLGGVWTNTATGVISAATGTGIQLGDNYAFDPLTAGANLDTWINNGSLTATHATVYLGGFLTGAATNLGGLHLTTDDLWLSGTLVNTNSTLSLKTAGGFNGSWVSIDFGLVYQGTVAIPSGNTVVFASQPTFDDLTAFTLAGTVDIESADDVTEATVFFDNPNAPLTISGTGTIQFGLSPESGGFPSAFPNEIFITGKTLTIGAGVTVALPGVESDGSVDSAEIDGPVVNLGTIAGSNGGALALNGFLDNQGTMLAGGTSTISINLDLFDPTDPTSVVTWTNEGNLQAAGGTLELGGRWTNNAAGKISATTGSTLVLGDTLSFDPATSPEDQVDAWLNLGSITATGASVFLGGWVTYSSSNLGGLDLSTDDLILAGTIGNTGQTMTFSTAGTLNGTWVSIAGGTVFQGNVIVSADSTIVFGSAGATLDDVDSFTLDGTLILASSDGFDGSTLTFDNTSGPLTIAGTGFIQIAGSGFFVFQEIVVEGSPLTFSSGISLVAGLSESIADISGPVINEGLVLGNNGGEIQFDDLLDNQGTLEATNGSAIFINSGEFDPTNPTTLITWTNEGTIEAFTDSELVLGGSWTNTSAGQILAQGENFLQLGDDLGSDTAATPNIELDAWTNDGTITTGFDASVLLGGWLTYANSNFGGLDLSGDQVTLQGILDNTGHTLAVSSSSSIDGNFTVEDGTIYQGDITTADGSAVTSFFGTFDGVTLDGTLIVADEFEAIIINGLTLNGTIELGDTQDASATLIFDDTASAQTLTGTGSIVFGTVVDSTSIFGPDEILVGGAPLTIDQGVAITGPGLDLNGLVDTGLVVGPVLMLGTAAEDAGGTISFQGPLMNLAAGTLSGGTWEVSNGALQFPSDITANAATVTIDSASAQILNGAGTNGLQLFGANLAGGVLTLQNGSSLTLTQALANSGTLVIGTGSSILDSAGYNQTDGLTTVDGSLNATQITLTGGMLSGVGTVEGNVTNGATVAPGDDPGTLTITGDYAQSSAGTLTLAIDDTAASMLVVSGTVTLDGTLDVSIAPDFAPAANSPITLIQFGQRTAGSDFATETGLGIVQQEFSSLAYGPTSLSLTETPYVLKATSTSLTASSPPAGFNGTVATFTDNFAGDTPASFTVSIDWGDNSPLDTTTGTITYANGVYSVQANHTYVSPLAASKSLPVTVTITSLSAPGVVATTSLDAPLGTISGVIFDDFSADGLLQSGELGLAGRTVFLDLNHNNLLDSGEPTAVSDSKGNYQFQNVIPGRYTLEMATLPGDSVTNSGGVFLTVQVTGGKNASSQNFGILNAFGPLPVSTDPTPFGSGNPDVQTATVHGLYVFILGRKPDANGLTFWAHALTTGAVTSSQLAAQFLHSPEYDKNEVISLYHSILNRTPKDPDVQFWVGQMQAGLDATGVALAFLKSGEFSSTHATNASFVQGLYVDIFGRGVDAGGLAFWTAQLNSKTTRDAMIDTFMHSTELYFHAVDSFYQEFLGRSGDAFGLSSWVDNLTAGKFSLTDVALAILGSGEFQHRASLTVS